MQSWSLQFMFHVSCFMFHGRWVRQFASMPLANAMEVSRRERCSTTSPSTGFCGSGLYNCGVCYFGLEPWQRSDHLINQQAKNPRKCEGWPCRELHLVERCFSNLKYFRRTLSHFGKLDRANLCFVHVVCRFIGCSEFSTGT